MIAAPAASCRPSRPRQSQLLALLGFLLAGCGQIGGGLAGTSEVPGNGPHFQALQTAAIDAPEDGDDGLAASYLAGRIALDDGDLRLAADNFGNALLRDPDNDELRRQVFTLRLGVGDYPAALDLAQTLIDRDPTFGDARLLLAFDAVKANDFAAAERLLDGIGERDFASLAKPILEAWVAFGAGDTARGLALLEEPASGQGLERIAQYHTALMLALAGRVEEAAERLRPLVDPETGNPIRLVLTLAALDARTGDVAAAEGLLRGQLEIDPGDVVLEATLAELESGALPALPVDDAASAMADALISLAGALDAQNASAQALILARFAAFLEPTSAETALLIAEINLGQDNADEALRALAPIPADSVYAWEGRLLSVQALAMLEREEDALGTLEQMADERPERLDALVAQGDILRRMERYAEAERAYDRALQRVSEIQVGHWPLLYARGITRERTDRWPEAEADFLKALELQPEQPLVLNYLGYSWVDQNMNLSEAEAMLRRAVELRPDDGYIVDSLGWAFYRLERYDEAVRYLERAVELRPDDPVINDHLGDAYWQVGRFREARFQWERALIFEPEAEEVAQIERKLEHGLQGPERNAGRG
jgi:tetratricopeptide (TPR) repeat protein